MIDYSNLPPVRYFERVLKTCPKAALLYLQLWINKNKYMNVRVKEIDIRRQYLMSPTVFRNLLSSLVFLDLVTEQQEHDKFLITISGMSGDV
jgi:hypothetical protein